MTLLRRKSAVRIILSFLEPSRRNLDQPLLKSLRKVRCKMRMMIEEQMIERETEILHKNLRPQRTRKEDQLTRKEMRIQTTTRKTEHRCIRKMLDCSENPVCSRMRRTVGGRCTLMKLIVESQRRLVENWKIHQSLGLEEKKNYFELHCMTAWVDRRRVLEVHRKVSEACRKVWVACRKASDDCRIALFLKLYFLQTALVSTLWVAIHLGSGVPVYMDQGIEF